MSCGNETAHVQKSNLRYGVRSGILPRRLPLLSPRRGELCDEPGTPRGGESHRSAGPFLEWRTLVTLTDKGSDGITVDQLCLKVVSLQSAQTKAIKRPDDAGLVRREDYADDLRRMRVTRQSGQF